jgi:hypothetical protein
VAASRLRWRTAVPTSRPSSCTCFTALNYCRVSHCTACTPTCFSTSAPDQQLRSFASCQLLLLLLLLLCRLHPPHLLVCPAPRFWLLLQFRATSRACHIPCICRDPMPYAIYILYIIHIRDTRDIRYTIYMPWVGAWQSKLKPKPKLLDERLCFLRLQHNCRA